MNFSGSSDILKRDHCRFQYFSLKKIITTVTAIAVFNQKWCPFIQNTCFFQLKYVPILMKKGMKIKIAEKIIQTIKINLFNNLTEKGIR